MNFVENMFLKLFLIFHAVSFSSIYGASFHSRRTFDPDGLVPPHDSSLDVCQTPGCVKSAADILEKLDQDADPCDNFYKFACGGWLEKHTIPDDKSEVDVFSDVQDELNLKLRVLLEEEVSGSESRIVKMLKDMYSSCMDLTSIDKSGSEPLQKVLKSLGGWPVVMGDKWDESNFDWMETIFTMKKLGYSHNILFGLSVSVDFRNNKANSIYLDQASLGMPDRSYYLEGLNDPLTAAYFNLMVKSAIKLGANEQAAENELKEALNFETALAKFSSPKEDRRSISNLYHKYALPELQGLVPQINWRKYFTAILNTTILENEAIIVFAPDFLKEFGKFINKSDKRTIANYMLGQVILSSIDMLSKDWRAMSQEYSSVTSGMSQDPPRWELCLSLVSGHLEIALSSHYVKNYFKGDSKHKAIELVKYIRKEFLVILENIDWMEKNTKIEAKEKAEAMTPHIGYPQELLNDTLVLEVYENLTITNKSMLENSLNVRKWATDNAFSELRKPNIKGEWEKYADVAQVNAYYLASENSIGFPAGILQNVFFSKDRPNYLNFGAIGYIIGHEITHGFDDEGREFDKEGNNKNWWDHKTDQLFKEKAQCIIYQYGNYTAENGQNLNGINTQGENIADNGGLKEAYLAYHSWVKDNGPELKLPGLKYTPSQLFWISAANSWCTKQRPELQKYMIISDSHSPAEFRVIGPMSNFKAFAKDFQCPPGSPMNPHKKCQVW